MRLYAAQLLVPISANELRPHTADFKKRRSLLKTRRLRPRPPGLSGGHFQHQVVLQTSRASVGLGPSAALGRAGRPYRPLFFAYRRLYDYDVNVRKIAQAILARLGAL